jgi:antitoxin (DNA-binding transcriptional repressor) of toxin-antitoxin stability system
MATLAIDINQLDPSDLLSKIEHGDTVWLTCNGQTVATVSPTIRLVSEPQQPATRQVGKWTLGLLQDVSIPASFDDPLDDELLDLFEGRSSP